MAPLACSPTGAGRSSTADATRLPPLGGPRPPCRPCGVHEMTLPGVRTRRRKASGGGLFLPSRRTYRKAPADGPPTRGTGRVAVRQPQDVKSGKLSA